MLTKEQAQSVAKELLDKAMQEREARAAKSTRSMVALFPALKHVAPSARLGALRDARADAMNGWLARLMLALIALAFVAYIVLDMRDQMDAARVAGWIAAVLFLGSQLQQQVKIRAHLRRLAGRIGETP